MLTRLFLDPSQILQPLLRSPVYQLLWNSRATPAFGTVRVRGEKVATSVDVSCDDVSLRAFREVVQRLTSQKSGGAVFVDQVGLSNFCLGRPGESCSIGACQA